MAKFLMPVEHEIYIKPGRWRKEGRELLSEYEPDDTLKMLHAEGACSLADNADLDFFPERGGPQKKQLAVCREQCDVMEECLVYAIENHEDHGIWGGMPIKDRLRLRRLIASSGARFEAIVAVEVRKLKAR